MGAWNIYFGMPSWAKFICFSVFVFAVEFGAHEYMASGLPCSVWMLSVYNFHGGPPPKPLSPLFVFFLPGVILGCALAYFGARWPTPVWLGTAAVLSIAVYWLGRFNIEILRNRHLWFMPGRGRALEEFWHAQAFFVLIFPLAWACLARYVIRHPPAGRGKHFAGQKPGGAV